MVDKYTIMHELAMLYLKQSKNLDLSTPADYVDAYDNAINEIKKRHTELRSGVVSKEIEV